MGQFAGSIAAFAKKAKMSNDKALRSASIKLFSAIITESPVDTGRFRANWMVSNGQSSTATTTEVDTSPGGEETKNKVEQYITGMKDVYAFTLANNLPYAHVIEYGGYPDPVKLGTWDKKKQAYEIRSAGGFSKQAPQGVVRVNIARFEQLLNEAAQEAKK